MNAKYTELNEERKRLPRSATGNRLSAVIKPLTDCLDHAFEKLEESRSRKGSGGARKPGPAKGGWVVAGEDDDDEEEEEDEEEDEEEREMRGGWSVVR